MKWIALIFVLLNIAYAAWQMQAEVASPPPPSKEPITIEGERQLILVSERKPEDKVPEPKAKPSPPPAKPEVAKTESKPAKPVVAEKKPTPPPPVAKACYSVGPFALVSDVSNAAHMFENAGITAQQRAVSERKLAGYWVFIPPLNSIKAARAVLRDLQNKELRDALIIAEGQKANAISAGVYYTEGQAYERRDKIREFGYDAKVEELTKTQALYWVDVELKKSSAIPAKLWTRVSKKYANISQKKRKCE